MDNKNKAIMLVDEFGKHVGGTDTDGNACFVDEYGYESVEDAIEDFVSMIEDGGDGGRRLRATDDIDELMGLMKQYLITGMPL